MSAYLSSGTRPRRSSVIALLIAAGVLYLAKEVLVPLAMAILLSFLLAPPARRLERLKLGRIPSTLLVAFLCFSIIGAIVGVAANQAISLAAKLPEYRSNITKKIQAIRAPSKGNIGKAAEALKDLEQQAAPDQAPIPVKETPGSPVEAFTGFLAPFAKPVGMALAVIVFTILMLLNRENMRERVIAVIGSGRINVTTRAMAEASYRVSRYLYMQLVVNAMFGVPFGIALYFIGIPNAMLWGLLGMVLRFIPYAGVWVAAAMPAMLAFAISDDWSMVAWTLGVFLALEMVLVNAVEPWLYGRSAGLSPIAVITAAIFWTWLWGPVGLLLATPLTVCVAVMGRHIPEFGYLNVLLGVEPVLSPEERFYQRLIALDYEESFELVEQHAAAQGAAATFEKVVIPALVLAESDKRKGSLEPARERFVYDAVRRIVEELDMPAAANAQAGAAVCIVPAQDEADHAAAQMLVRLLGSHDNIFLVKPPAQVSEVVDIITRNKCKAVCISAVPPHSASHAGYLARRLRRHFPELRIVVGLWVGDGEMGQAKERLAKLGVDEVAPQLSAAAEALH